MTDMQPMQPNPNPQRVLIVAAHPDDGEFMAGGTLAHWSAQGASIHYCLVTDGTGGSRDPNQTPEQLAAIRREEQRNAAKVLGSDDVTFLGYVDGRVEPTLELRFQIARVIRRVRPDVVITQDPNFRYSSTYINHPDHRAVADATLAAIMPIANTRLSALELLEEGLEPHVGEAFRKFAVDAVLARFFRRLDCPFAHHRLGIPIAKLALVLTQCLDFALDVCVCQWHPHCRVHRHAQIHLADVVRLQTFF
jgi:LmbE family N-acetylglucosaminyl deacetylase